MSGSSLRAAPAVTLAELSYDVRTWGVDAGLLGTRPYAVAQSREGYLWVGTRNGLFRFNGARFTHFDTKAIPEIGQPFVSALCGDAEGGVWLALAGLRIVHFRDGQFKAAPIPKSFGNLNTWTARPGGGVVASFRGETTSSILAINQDGFDLLATLDAELDAKFGRITSMAFSANGRLWGATRDGYLIEIRDGAARLVPLEDERGFGTLLKERDGTLVGIGHRGAYVYHDGSWRLQHPFETPPGTREVFVYSCVDANGHYWFGTPHAGVWIWTENNGLRQLVPGRNSIPSPVVSLDSDAEGNVLFLSFSGLYQARYSPFVTRRPPMEVPTPRVIGVSEDGDGAIWFSCFGGICRMAPGDREPTLEIPRSATEINAVAGSHGRGVWFGNKDGYFANWKDGRLMPVYVPRMDRAVFSPTGLMQDHEGTVWLPTLSGMLVHRPSSDSATFEPFPDTNGLPRAYLVPHLATPTRNGDLFVAARDHGVFRKSPEETTWRLVTPEGDPVASEARVITVDPTNRVWVLSREDSIGCWSPGTAVSGRIQDLGFPECHIVGMVADDDGGMWFATLSDGVAHVDCERLEARLRDPTQGMRITWFDRSSGLGSKGGSFTSSAIFKSSDGLVWVATEGGISSINPRLWRDHQDRSLPPRVEIEMIRADDSALPAQKRITVPAGTARVAIHYTDFSFGPPGEARFRYRLRGLDDTWIDAGGATEAVFLLLPPRHYQFEVLAANRYGTWSTQPARVEFEVAPLWWQRDSVRAAGALAVALVAILFYRSRLAASREREALQAAFSRQLIESQEMERKRIARELHDGLGPNLTIAKNRLTLEQERRAAIDQDASALKSVSDLVSQTIHEVRNISQGLRPYVLDRAGITRAIGELVGKITDATRLPIRADIAPIDGKLTSANEIHLFRIIQEGLNNIVKHADASAASLSVRLSERTLVVSIEDDGRGFDRDALRSSQSTSGGMGLAGMEERARIMGGTFHCRSGRRQGTLLTLELPLTGQA